jgi:phosphoglycerol transferase MdoB-like AlkP superfamily enzyme
MSSFAEVEVLPYLIDTIEEAKSNEERLFLSHFTSTTHHPWGLPSGFESEDYWGHNRIVSEHEDNNKYLNAVRYVDTWIGTMMQALEDTGIANETLVVFVGDQLVPSMNISQVHLLNISQWTSILGRLAYCGNV